MLVIRDYVLEGAKWGNSGTDGTSGGQVTWSFATTTGSQYSFDYVISDPAYQQAIQDAFNMWESVANIDFVQVADSSSSDIRLGWDSLDGVGGILAETSLLYDQFSGVIGYAEIAFDEAETYTTDENYVGIYTNFYVTALHEIGHALGLDHSPDPNDVMYAYEGDVTSLSADDIAGAQYIYGAAASSGAVPTTGADLLTGTSGDDAIAALAGNDTVSGLGGNDVLTGNAGSDDIDGGTGNDAIWAGSDDASPDYVSGGDGNDTLAGGAGDDTLYGGYGSDLLFGGAGDDYLDVGIASTFTGEGSGSTNTAWAGAGSDIIQGDDTSDLMGGGSGSDLFLSYGGNDVIYGGAASASETANDDSISSGEGNDTVYGGVGSDLITGDENDDLLFGGADADYMAGGTGKDRIWGGAGDDTLFGEAGGDTFGFDTGSGFDIIADFDSGEGDRLDLNGQTYTITSIGGDLELLLSGGGSIVFDGVAQGDFQSGWIV